MVKLSMSHAKQSDSIELWGEGFEKTMKLQTTLHYKKRTIPKHIYFEML